MLCFSLLGDCDFDIETLTLMLTLKIPGPHFLLNYRVNANWHECLNGIIVYYLPSLRLPVDVYGWYRSDLSPACHQSD